MGNEMGNNNTSGMQEEENTNPEAQEKSFEEPNHANDVKGEIQVVPEAENKDYHQKETGIASDYPKEAGDNPTHNHISDGTGQEEPEGHPPVESSKPQKKFDEEDGVDCEIQPAASLPKELEVHDNQVPSNSEEKILEISNNQIEKQSSFKTEEEDMLESTSAAISSANDPEDSGELKSNQHEVTKVHSDQSKQDSTNSMTRIEDMPESSIAYSSKENGHLLDHCISDSLEATVLSTANLDVVEKREELLVKELASQEDEMSSKEKFEVEVGIQDVSETAMVSSDHVEANNGEIATKMNCNGTNSLESLRDEVSLPADKRMELTKETKLIGKETESADSKHDDNESVRVSEIDKENAHETDSLTRPHCVHIEKEVPFITAAASNGNCQVEEVKVFEESDSENEASEERCEESEGKVMMIHELEILEPKSSIPNGKINEGGWKDCEPEASVMAYDAARNGNCQVEEAKAADQSDNQNENSEEHLEGSEGKIIVVPELGNFADESSIANGKNYKEESVLPEPEAYIDHDAVTNGNYIVEEAKFDEVSDNHIEAHEGKVMMAPEFTMLTSEFHTTNGKHKAEEEEPAEKQIGEIKENIQAPCATKRNFDDTKCGEQLLSQPLPLPPEAPLLCCPAAFYRSEDHQQENVMKSENAQNSSDSTVEMKPESSSDFFAATASSFHATSFAVETLVSEAELEIEKSAEEGLHQVTEAATEMVKETDSLASTYNSSEQHQKIDTSTFEKDKIQAQENESRVSTLPISESLIQAEESSITESTASAVELGNKKPQQEVPHYNTVFLETETKANSSASAIQFSDQYEKAETSVIETGGYKRQASVGRFSNESFPDYWNTQAEMRKSPSFNLDLRIEARSTEESDKTPLLYQDKNTIEGLSSQDDINLQSAFSQAQHGQEESNEYKEMPVEEKVIMLERSDSEKLKTPFLGFLKEDEEGHVVVIPKKQDKHASALKNAMPSKSKEKHKHRSSLFANCMCCTTAIN